MSLNQFKAAVLIGTLIAFLLFDYLMALAGEPRALWMWRDVLRLID